MSTSEWTGEGQAGGLGAEVVINLASDASSFYSNYVRPDPNTHYLLVTVETSDWMKWNELSTTVNHKVGYVRVPWNWYGVISFYVVGKYNVKFVFYQATDFTGNVLNYHYESTGNQPLYMYDDLTKYYGSMATDNYQAQYNRAINQRLLTVESQLATVEAQLSKIVNSLSGLKPGIYPPTGSETWPSD